MVSTHNPFRTTAVTPTPTGASITSRTTPPGSSSAGNPSTSLRNGSRRIEERSRSRTPEDRSVNDLLSEELPPAYTPAPNVYEGEATLELGPRRPFQNAARVPPQNQQGWVSPQSTAGPWSGFPGSMHRESAHMYTRPAPPPMHPSPRGARPSSAPVEPSTLQPLSEFARDFYAAGAANDGVLGGPSAQYQTDTPRASSSSSGPSYAPPPGPPPTRGAKSGPTSPSSPRDQVPDDGRPTERPVPGHPLLRHGRVLVYPKDYECPKCHNTGYKNYDPSHPCTRCWDKHAKAYSGTLLYVPWGREGGSGTSRTSLQRPLPQFRAPQSSLHGDPGSSWSAYPSARSDHSRSASTSRIGSGYPGGSTSGRVIPVAGGGVPMDPYLDTLQGRGRSAFPPPSWFGTPAVVPVNRAPPSTGNAAVYAPGDPRIGGRLCWRCGGDGKTSFLIFDEETCRVCNGIGRTFV
ncbi:hypothetical protein BC628DRAFT_1423059 [Trametes gibbosa]|nr:hypothetical protein BC628DRAFT_1423059 [Trametes gibbosa]